MATPEADPLTAAELDALDALNRARTPGPVDVLPWPGDGEGYAVAEVDGWIVRSRAPMRCENAADDARAIAAALNALPALLAEVRASRAAPAPYLIDALEAYGRAFCRAAHLDTQARRTALADAERAVLRCVEGASK